MSQSHRASPLPPSYAIYPSASSHPASAPGKENSAVTSPFTYKAKVVLLGSSGVGKTSILTRKQFNQFTENQTPPTLGASYSKCTINLGDGEKVSMDVWDTAGQERFRSMVRTSRLNVVLGRQTPIYFRNAKAAFAVYNVNQPDTWEDLKTRIQDFRQHLAMESPIVMIVGNKIDLTGRQVDKTEAKSYAQKENCFYNETSAKTGEGILEIFETIARKMFDANASKRYYDFEDSFQLSDKKETGGEKQSNCCSRS